MRQLKTRINVDIKTASVVNSRSNPGIICCSKWMTPHHLMMSRRPLQTSFSQHMSFSRPTVVSRISRT
eukprot:1926799-Amphidinium_carterae.2